MTNRPLVHTSPLCRSGPKSPPSLLVVGKSVDLRLFLRAGLQKGYRIVTKGEGEEGARCLTHGTPQGLVVGQISGKGEQALAAALRDAKAPPVLKLWATALPPDWADRALRHPFTRADLLRAVGRLVHGKGRNRASERTPAPGDARIEANGRA